MKNIISFTFFLVCLLFSTSYCQNYLSGPISGLLQDSLYYVIGNISVEEGDSLIISPGVSLRFRGAYSFTIQGYFQAQGTENDSIVFIPDSGYSRWNGIIFSSNASDSCKMCYCLVNRCQTTGVTCSGSVTCFQHCNISGHQSSTPGGGMACRAGANVTLQDCLIFNNITSNPGGGIYIDSSQVTVYGSQICENSGSNTGAGIYAKNNSILLIDCSNIQGNYIDVIGESYGGGLYVWDTHLEISYSTITENSLESMMPYTAGLYCTGSRATMVKNCTISRNTLMGEEAFFAAVYGHSDTLIFENTIIEGHWGTENCFYISPTSDSVSIRYCDFYNNDPGNFTGSLPQGLGILRSINANGDSCDIYFNIYLDPLFYSIAGDSAYYLSANSPCIDAGDPASPLDPDSTIADIGAFYYNQYIPSIQTLTITISDNDIILQWGDVPEAEIYYIYRSTEPYFEVTGLNPIGSGTEPGFTDVNALTEDHYYYRVTYEY